MISLCPSSMMGNGIAFTFIFRGGRLKIGLRMRTRFPKARNCQISKSGGLFARGSDPVS